MPKVTFLRGVSGSGKSTWARAQVGSVVVSRDDLRAAIFGSDGPDYYKVDKTVLKRREDYITKVEHTAIEQALRAGLDVISDNTNIEMKYLTPLVALAQGVGAETEVKVFDVALGRAVARVGARAGMGGRDVPVDVIQKQHSRLQQTKDHPLPVIPRPTPYTGTPGKPEAVLVDIDGTLAHMHKRRGPFEWHNVSVDELDEVIADIVRMLYFMDRTIILMSGRDEVCREQTVTWLAKHNVPYDELFMRPEKDMRKDNLVKAELFDNHVRDHYDVRCVLDDRDQVVAMWREMGIKTLQVAEGDF